jgi:hypothetical protein
MATTPASFGSATTSNRFRAAVTLRWSALAISYAVNIIAMYQEYRWRHYVATHQTDKTAFRHLQDDDRWQQGHLTNERNELELWIKGGSSKGAAS